MAFNQVNTVCTYTYVHAYTNVYLYIHTCLAKSRLTKFIFWIDSTSRLYSTEIRLTLIESVERFTDPIKLSTTARNLKNICTYVRIHTCMHAIVTQYDGTYLINSREQHKKHGIPFLCIHNIPHNTPYPKN